MGITLPNSKELLLSHSNYEQVLSMGQEVGERLTVLMREVSMQCVRTTWKFEPEFKDEEILECVDVVDGNARFALQKLIAPGYTFNLISTDEPSYTDSNDMAFLETAVSPEDEEILIGPNFFDSVAALPMLLHEIGHTNQPKASLAFLQFKEWLAMQKMFVGDFGIDDPDNMTNSVNIKNREIVPALRAYHTQSTGLETDAWQKATTSMDTITEAGVPVWSSFPDDVFEDLKKLALLSHKHDQAYELFLFGGRKALEEME